MNGAGRICYGSLKGTLCRTEEAHKHNRHNLLDAQLSQAVSYWNSTYAGAKDARGVTVPSLILPSNYALSSPIISQDMRVTKEFTYRERYKFDVFGEFFNVLNVSNLAGINYALDPVQAKQTFAFGQPTARVGQQFGTGGPRAIQLGARFSF